MGHLQVIVVPSIINNSLCAATKAVFNILIFFLKTPVDGASYCAIIFLNVGLDIICLNQIDTHPAAFLAELQKP